MKKDLTQGNVTKTMLLAYLLAPLPQIGVLGIWRAIFIGWGLADLVGITCIYRIKLKKNGEING